MAKKPQRGRGKPENPRKYKKKTSPLLIEKVEYVDYKDVDLLSRFMSDRAKIRNMRVSGNNRQQQLEIANAIKIAREMALLPYARRVASTGRPGRGGRDRDGGRDGGRPSRDESRDSQSDSSNESTEATAEADTSVSDGAAAESTTDESEA
ncbi:MAG: 30S ribosomal protein S18 [Ilumatobacteraceae bacterium]|nr:30S ribosomal protein S18 [Ilumatobacteraceae bacterium]